MSTLNYSPVLQKLRIALLLVVIALSCAALSGIVASHHRVHDLFDLAPYVGATPDHIQSALLEQYPVGSTESIEIERAFRARGFEFTSAGPDRCSSKSDAQLTCTVNASCPAWRLLSESTKVRFLFDASKHLRSIDVSSRFVRCSANRASASQHLGNP